MKVRLPEILANQDIDWEKGGHVLRVSWNGHLARFAPLLVSQPGLAALKDLASDVKAPGKSSDPVPLVVAPYLGQEARRLCRDHGLQFLDLSGNVWINRGPLLIEKEVPRSRYSREAVHRSPFADRASLVLRHLLGKAGAAAGVREISVAIGISAGYVSKVLREAEQARYVQRGEDGRFRIKNPREVLGDWCAFYQWRKNSMESFFLAPDRNGKIDEALGAALRSLDGYALSVHAGNNLIEPFAQGPVWHVYAESEAIVKRIKDHLPIKPVGRDAGNLVLMRPYYRASAFHGARLVKGLRVVSDLQLYLDLHDYPVRGAEAADHVLRRRLAPAWKLEEERARV